VLFLRGLLRAKLNDACASDYFKLIVARDLDPKKRSQQGMSICEIKLRVAYAYKALGDDSSFLKKIEEAKTYN